MEITLRSVFTHLAVTSLFATLLTAPALAALDDGYPEGTAAPGRTCLADAVGQKELSSFSGKNLECILINGVAKWWIVGDPLPAIETPEPQASAPASDGKKFVLEKGVKITLKKGSKLIKVGDVRPAQVLIPGTLKAKVAAPLLVALPGFTATTNDLLALVDLTAEAYKRGVVLALPMGSKNSGGLHFWNATGSCCDFEKSGVDDPKQPYASVQAETGKWAQINGCSTGASVVNKKKFNYESVLAGSETTKSAYKCPKGVDVEMWTIAGGAHLPKINAAFTSAVFDFLLAHKK
jgi:hypothetical protein